MDVDTAVGGHIQHLLGKDAAIGYHRADIRLQGAQLLHRLLLPEILRLENRQVMGKGHLLDGRRHQLHAPALGTVRLGVNADNLKAVGKDLL